MEENTPNEHSFWLCLKPEVYYVRKQNRVLLYNTETGDCKQSDDSAAVAFLEKLYSRENPGSILVTDYPSVSKSVPVFIQECISDGLIDSEPFAESKKRPVRLAPILNLQRDIDKIKQEPGRSLGEDVFCYLSDVTLIINSDCTCNCPSCKNYCYQFAHCGNHHSSTEMHLDTIRLLFNQTMSIPLRRLLVTGGNIMAHSRWEEISHFFTKNGICPTLGIHYRNITSEDIGRLQEFPLLVFVDAPFDKTKMTDVAEKLQTSNTRYQFSVASSKEYNEIMPLVEKCNINNFTVVPFYTGNNRTFFDEQVFVQESDILSGPITQQLIFARQKMNTNFFGEMMIFPNGDVKSNINGTILGNINQQHLIKMVEKELSSTNFWRHTRTDSPCCDCLFQFLCPSPSNYEFVMHKNNLCHVEK